MPNPTTTADIAARWRDLTVQETTNANAFMDDAWALLLSRRPNLDADMIAGTVTTANVIRVVSTMVLRLLKNPDGYESESLDDWTGRRAALLASGVLHVTSDELADITPGRRIRKSVRLVAYGDV